MRMQIIFFIILTAIADESSAQSTTLPTTTIPTTSIINSPCNPYFLNYSTYDIAQGCLSNCGSWGYLLSWITFGVGHTLPRYCPLSSCLNPNLWSPDGKYH